MVYRYGLADSPEILNGLSSSCERAYLFNESARLASSRLDGSTSWRTRCSTRNSYLYQVGGQFQYAVRDHEFLLLVRLLLDL